jgi:uncharacterized membrane protein
MSEDNDKSPIELVAINSNEQIRKLRTAGDKLADRITKIAGSPTFLVINIIWFTAWILINTGAFGENLIFDEYPFGFLTMVVSLEAILLSVFVLISQNRSSKRSEIRAELDYITDLHADAENVTIIHILEKIAKKQDIDISKLLKELEVSQKRIFKEHPISDEDLEL